MRGNLMIMLILALAFKAKAQITFNYTVPLRAQTQESPRQITLSWDFNSGTINYSVSRKSLYDSSWTILAPALPGSVLSFTDTDIAAGKGYEYRVIKTGYYPKNGVSYVYAGIKIPATEYRGKMILMVDNYFTASLSAEISQLENDLIGDGWAVIRHDVSRTDSVKAVKTMIEKDYYSDTENVKALFLLGHVPVPYSGDYAADSHDDHKGAWPSDVYYSVMDGEWTDSTVNITTALHSENHNIPGDGKFDQSVMPADSRLQTGRVDFANLPAIPLSETQLMRNYLCRLHAYKFKNFNPPKKCIIDDNFGDHGGEAFASNGWRLASIITPDSISENDYFTALRSNPYQWSYACGSGGYSICQGVGYITDFAADTIQTVFSLLLGSGFGDWDCKNNFLRGPLTAGALATAWAGRPHWHFHSMSLGETIGFCAKLAQNNSTTYTGNMGMRNVHIALLGDPSLRQHIIAPPANLIALNEGTNHAELKWSPSHDTVLGYYIYKLDTVSGIYNRISPSIVKDTNFTDKNITTDMNYYMVRAVRIEKSVTGTYFNMSQGIFDTVQFNNASVEYIPQKRNIMIYPNPAREECLVTFPFTINNINIFDTALKLIASYNVNEKKYLISLKGLTTGIYILKIDGMYKKLVVSQ